MLTLFLWLYAKLFYFYTGEKSQNGNKISGREQGCQASNRTRKYCLTWAKNSSYCPGFFNFCNHTRDQDIKLLLFILAFEWMNLTLTS